MVLIWAFAMPEQKVPPTAISQHLSLAECMSRVAFGAIAMSGEVVTQSAQAVQFIAAKFILLQLTRSFAARDRLRAYSPTLRFQPQPRCGMKIASQRLLENATHHHHIMKNLIR